ncbi:MAG: TonB-dependent receptor, partial [Woeseiaceae bacterium]
PSIQGRDLAFGGPPSTALSETITSAEIGFKSNLSNNRVRLNGAVFYYQVDDQQITAVGGVSNAIQLVNADKANAFGFDFDLDALLTENLLLQLAVGYNDTEIDDPNLRIPTCGSGACTVVDDLDVDGFAIVDGNPLPNAPEWNYNIRLQYSVPMSAGELYFATDWMFQSDIFGRNITDEENLKGVIDFNNNTGFVNDRRIWGATFAYYFGEL